MKLKSGSGEKPLWSQLYDILEERIQTNVYPVGENMPTEAALMKEFDVSRITVRQAMDKLLTSQLIVRRRGKGTIVLARTDKIETTFQSRFNGINEKNNNRNRKVISFNYVKAPIEAAYFFNLSEEDKVLCLVREIYVDDQVVAHFETYLNKTVPLDKDDDMEGSLYKKLQSLNLGITNVVEKISASLSDPIEKELFHLDHAEAIIHRNRMGCSNNTPIEFTYSKYLSDGYELTITLQKTSI